MNKDKILMPKALTAENGAKAALVGEYHEEQWIDCPECHGYPGECENCEECDGEGGGHAKVAVEWTTIKKIYSDCVSFLGKSDVDQCITKEKPAELPAKRFRVKLSGDDIYVSISYNNGMPWEVFTTTPCSWDRDDPRRGYIGAINRLAALSLQDGTTLGTEKVVDQLGKSSAGDGDYVGALAGLLRGRMISRKVTERDFRKPEFSDANPEEYEFRADREIVRKDRWERGIKKIAFCLLGESGRGDYEIDNIVVAIKWLLKQVPDREDLGDKD